MDKILVVEDDKTVYSGIKKLLELQHYSVVIAQNGMEALEKIDESFSLVIMDIMMPQLDGIETCRRMRERHSVPILFLSAKSEELDKLEGLEVGGDDYMTKPFSNMELISKVKALIRRYRVYDSGSVNRKNKDESIEADGLKLFTNRNKVEFNCDEIKLTGKEYEILKLLMKNPDRIYTIEMIYEMVWDEVFTYNAKNTVMVHIKNLRNKLIKTCGDACVHTEWGRGYRFER